MTNTHFLSVVFVLLLSTFLSQGANDGFIVFKGVEHDLTSISELDVADLLSHVNGLPPVHQETNRKEFPKTNLFSSPALNIIVAIDAITPEILKKADISFLNIQEEQSIQMTKADYPEDGLSTLTTVMTGEHYQNHGIVGQSWKASNVLSVEAYSHTGTAKVAKITDRAAVLSNGAARIIALSGSKKMASAMGVHTELALDHPEWNIDTMHFSKHHGLVDLYNGETINTFSPLRHHAAEWGITLKTVEGYVLTSELLAISQVAARLQDKIRNDNNGVPDFVCIGIDSVKRLSMKYGEDSLQVIEALELIDRALIRMINSIERKNIYGSGKIVTEIIGLQSSTEEHTFYSQIKQQKEAKILTMKEGDKDSEDQYSADEISAFQTKLWVAVAIFIAAILATFALVTMDKLENSLIYKTTDGPRPIQDVR